MSVIDVLELEKRVRAFLGQELSLESLESFAWEKIDEFTKSKDSLAPYDEEIESVYWYAIWRIQHLADGEEEHAKILKKEMAYILDCLQKKKSLPKELKGKRPV